MNHNQDLIDGFSKLLLERLLALVATFTDAERERMFEELRHRYCVHCGREQGERRCQCWNDE